MAQATKVTPYLNGTGAENGARKEESARELTPAQRRHIGLLITQLHRAEFEIEARQEARDTAQRNANQFILYCAEDLGVPLGKDQWHFDQERMAFVQVQDKTTAE